MTTPLEDSVGGVADAAPVGRTESGCFAAFVDGSAAACVGSNDRRGAFDGKAADSGVDIVRLAGLGAGVFAAGCGLLFEDC